jgi:hypothetical protein
MKKNLLSSIFVIGVTLVSLFLLVGCQLEAKVATAAENAGIVYAVDPVDLKLFNAADPSPTNRGVEIDANTARWISLGERYSEDTLTSDRVANANIARWNTMGEHYQTMALDDIELATKAYTARWVSLGQSYSEDTLTSDRVANANMTRWNAMGEHYQAMALDDIELAAKAKIAR